MFDVHESLQEHSVKFKYIPGYSNEKFKFKKISVTVATWPWPYPAVAHVTHRQLAESPLQNKVSLTA